MPAITLISVLIATYRHEDAGTDGDVYFGICGREFHCDTEGDDFNPNTGRYYHFGDVATPAYGVRHPAANDPRNPRLHTSELGLYPVYLRFDQGSSDHWALQEVRVYINGSSTHQYERQFFSQAPLWLGKNSGNYCYLYKVREIADVAFAADSPNKLL
jgi:hypothetical protein